MFKVLILLSIFLLVITRFRISSSPAKEMMPDDGAGHFAEHKLQKNPAAETKKDVKKRAENAALINKWIAQMNASSSRPSISRWEYKNDTSDEIIFTFTDGIPREGKVSFIYEPALPRVSQLAYTADSGETKRLRGYISASFNETMLVNNFLKEKASQKKRSYLNSVGFAAAREGAADLNILTYQQITEEEFYGMFGKKEIKAFIKSLSEDFDEVAQTDVPYILRVKSLSTPV